MYVTLYDVPFEILYFSIHQHAALCKEKWALVEMNRRQASEGTHCDYVCTSSSIRKEILQCWDRYRIGATRQLKELVKGQETEYKRPSLKC